MPNFINKGIFNNYSLNKINNLLLGGNLGFNFSTIKIGDGGGNSLVLDPSLTDLINPAYSLDILDTILGNKTVTFIAKIPGNIEDFNIREIGIYEKVGSQEFLVAISSANIYKPTGLDYILIIEIHYNLNVKSIAYELVSLGLIPSAYILPGDLDLVKTNLLQIVKFNLMRTINKNYIGLTGELLPDMLPEEIPNYTLSLFDDIIDFDSVADLDNLSQVYNIYGSTLIAKVFKDFNNYRYDLVNLSNLNSFFKLNILNQKYSIGSIRMGYYFNNNLSDRVDISQSYLVNDLSLVNSNLNVNTDKSFIANIDNDVTYSMGDSPFTLLLNLKLSNLEDQVLLNYVDSFILYLQDGHLFFELLSSSGLSSFKVGCNLDYTSCNTPTCISITYNGDKNAPVINVYLDGLNITGASTNTGYTGMPYSPILVVPLQNYDDIIGGLPTKLSKAEYNSISLLLDEASRSDVLNLYKIALTSIN